MLSKVPFAFAKSESPLESFKRTLALAEAEHEKAIKELTAAANELTQVYENPCEDCPARECKGYPYAKS